MIGSGAFSGCRRLKNIHIPDTVSDIGNCAFSGCDSLKKLELPAGLMRIGVFALRGCKDLGEIRFGGTMRDWKYAAWNVHLGVSVPVICSDGSFSSLA